MSRRERIIALSAEIADLRDATTRREEELDRLLALDEESSALEAPVAPAPVVVTAPVVVVKALPANGHQRRGTYCCGGCGEVGHTLRSKNAPCKKAPLTAASAPPALAAPASVAPTGTGELLRCHLSRGQQKCGATVRESEVTQHVRQDHGLAMNMRAAREYFTRESR